MVMVFDEKRIRETLIPSWSLKTAPQWIESTPWAGQCNVTSAVISELFGVEILRTPWNEQTDHYYNRVNGERFDFTDMQFEQPIKYMDTPTTIEEVNNVLKEASNGALKGILAYEEEPLVSVDYMGMRESSCVDSKLTNVIDGTNVKVVAWYDNEAGFSNRVIDLATYIGKNL